MTDATLNLNINSGNARRQLGNIDTGLDRVEKTGARTSRTVNNLGKAFIALGSALAVRQIIQTASNMERLNQTLNTVFMSTEAGNAAFSRLRELTLELPFTLDQLAESAIKLRAGGIEPTNEQLRIFADIAASSVDPVGSLSAVTDLFSRNAESGGVGLEDLNRLADRGIPIFGLLSRVLGISRLEVSGLGRTAEGTAMILNAVSTNLGELTQGAAANATDTLAGQLSNLQSSYDEFIITLGETGAIDALTETIRLLANLMVTLSENLGTFTLALGTGAVVAFRAYNSAAIVATTSTNLFTAALLRNPLTFVITTALAAGVAVISFKNAIDDAQESVVNTESDVARLNERIDEIRRISRTARRGLSVANEQEIAELKERIELTQRLTEFTDRQSQAARLNVAQSRDRQTQREQDQVRIDELTQSLKTEEELIRDNLNTRLADIAEGNARGIINDQMAQQARVIAEFQANQQIVAARMQLNETLASASGIINVDDPVIDGTVGPRSGTAQDATEFVEQGRLDAMQKEIDDRRLHYEQLTLLRTDFLQRTLEDENLSEELKRLTIEQNMELEIERQQDFYLRNEQSLQEHLNRIMEIRNSANTAIAKVDSDSMKGELSFRAFFDKTKETMEISAFKGALDRASQGNKQLFEINKAYKIAEAITSTYTGATNALAETPPNFAKAALIVATGLLNVATISSTSFGSRGGSSGGRGVTGSSAAATDNRPTPPPPPQPVIPNEGEDRAGIVVNNFIEGSIIDTEGLREVLVEQLDIAEANDERVASL